MEENPVTDAELRSDPNTQINYGDILALYPDHPIVLEDNVLRWQRSPMMRWLSDNVDINAMWLAYHHSAFPLEDFTRFYRDMGYSLCGFIDIFGDELGLYEDEDEAGKTND